MSSFTVTWRRIRRRLSGYANCFPIGAATWTCTITIGLLRERATYAHCIYLNEADRPGWRRAVRALHSVPARIYIWAVGYSIWPPAMRPVCVSALATDVGGGSSFSMLRTMAEAYKVAHLLRTASEPLRAFYLATLAGARMLGLADKIGHFALGTEADFIVLDPHATPLLARRMAQSAHPGRASAAVHDPGGRSCGRVDLYTR